MSRITITNLYQDLTGAAYSGKVLFAPTVELQDIADGITIGTTPVVATLDGSGRLSISLDRCDDPNVVPNNTASNSWAYQVTEQVIAPGSSFVEPRQPFYVVLTAAMGASASLAAITHYGAQPGYGYMFGTF